LLTACPPTEPECSADKACPDGQTCVDGACQAASSGPFDLRFDGQSFTANIGKTLRVAVIDVDAGDSVVKTDSQSIGSNGGFSFSWPDLLTGGHRYQVHYYVDMNGDSTCTAASDHAWQESVAAVSADVVLDVTRRATYDDVCATFGGGVDGGGADSSSPPPWDLTITGTGFGARGVTNLAWAVVFDGDDAPVTAITEATVVDGFFSFTWTDLLQPAESYSVHFFLDLDSDGACELNEGGYEVIVGVVTGDTTLPLVSSMQRSQVCDSFNPADAGSADSATVDSAVATDAATAVDAAAADAGTAEDAARVEDAALVEDAASEDA
jgi:hypothetical protein